MMDYLSPFLWYLFQIGCSVGFSYGAFFTMYYSALRKYKNKPPVTINGCEISHDKWDDICNTCERYPFYNMPETVLEADFLTSPVKHEENPVVNRQSLKFSQKVRPTIGKTDEVVMWITMITLGRSLPTFVFLQLINILLFTAAGFHTGITDPVAKYVRLPIKKLE